ncbi:MAG: NAD(P)-dependent oxidoreductase [Gammaproteobacteria bacterium]|nr:NAD(P)-dependent oxidoreductase [Gammaproteobacteria bacterium]
MTAAASSPVTPRTVAFVGLGVMGYPMAGHLARAGHHVTVYNRTAAKAEAWVREYGGRRAPTPRAAATGADLAFTCVGNDDDVRSVVLGPEGLFAGLANGTLFVDCTTASAELARELAAAGAARGIGCVDAPVSGGQAGAVNGQLTVMCGGSEADIDGMRPVALAFARAVTRIGASGSGQLAKMVNQICIAGLLQGLAEGIAFGEAAGLDMKLVLGVLGQGAAQSWQMAQRGPTMVEDRFDFGFAVDWMRKDLALCRAEARRHGIELPVAALVDGFYAELQARGGGRWDTSSLVRRLRVRT